MECHSDRERQPRHALEEEEAAEVDAAIDYEMERVHRMLALLLLKSHMLAYIPEC